MAHTPFFQNLRRIATVARASAVTGLDEAELNEKRCAVSISRRQFIGTAAAAATVAATPFLRAAKPSRSGARVVVVGAGLAGLTCAYRLKQAGLDATLYEANSRVGGRCWTRRNDFRENQIAEHGGELIDQGHVNIRHLAQELRLPLDNLLAAEPNGSEPFFYFGQARYSYREATNDLKAIWQKLHRDLSEAGYPTLYNRSTARGRQLDQMSVRDWIIESVPGGVNSRLGQLLEVGYNIEYGAEPETQSALNLIYLLAYNSPGQFNLFGASNEKFHVRGGNDRIVSTLVSVLSGQVVTGESLVAARRTAGGAYTLTFQNAQGMHDVAADKVVFALPFSILRNVVDISAAGFSPLKLTAIDELPMGSNAKLNLQFSRRHWVTLGGNGDTFASTGYQASWEVTRAQPGAAGILVGYSGGNHAEDLKAGTPATQAAAFLAQIEPVLPGLGAYFNQRATVDYWGQTSPFTRGSYAYWKKGQYTAFAGIEGVQERNAHFCGEHTSIDSQGYLNGAVETGERAAAEIVGDLGL
ncbi:MAG: FAD-dependent oxidoreductase [Opitutaceae bacterium]